jgi:hypothetical protein
MSIKRAVEEGKYYERAIDRYPGSGSVVCDACGKTQLTDCVGIPGINIDVCIPCWMQCVGRTAAPLEAEIKAPAPALQGGLSTPRPLTYMRRDGPHTRMRFATSVATASSMMDLASRPATPSTSVAPSAYDFPATRMRAFEQMK